MSVIIFFIIYMLVPYVMAFYAGYKWSKEKSNNNEPSAAMWKTMERVYTGIFCVVYLCFLLDVRFNVITWYLKEILTKLGELTNG